MTDRVTTATPSGPQSPRSDGPQSPQSPQSPQAPQTPQQTTAKAPAPRAEACPDCGAPAEPGQLACLGCGKRLKLRYRRPPSWRVPAAIVAGVLVLLAIGVGFGLREIASDAEIESTKESAQPAQAAPQPPLEGTANGGATGAGASAGAATGADAATPPEATGASKPPEASPSSPSPAKPPPAPKTIQAWPPGATGWTAVLASTDTRAGARAKAREAIGRGIPAGVLRSGDFSSLKSGFWVVFAGRTPSEAKGKQLATSYGAKGYPGAYARFVKK